ncbi:DEAD/DEAH box helicase [candidate division KSB1 bacterium]|nr:DEAD/DEAH box helicase [candidate division KSB1 bacterium]
MNHFPRALENRFPAAHLQRGRELFANGACINFDFVRNSFVAQVKDNEDVHQVVVKKKQYKDNFTFTCDCGTYMRNMICPHIAALLCTIFSEHENPQSIYDNISKNYYESFWELLAKLCYEAFSNRDLNFRFRIDNSTKFVYIDCLSDKNEMIFSHLVTAKFSTKIINKYKYILFKHDSTVMEYILNRDAQGGNGYYDLPYTEKTELEERMNLAGYKSWLQKFEESLWFDFSKIWYLNIPYPSIRVNYEGKAHQIIIESDSLDFEFHVPPKQISEIINAFHKRPDLNNILNISSNVIRLNYSLKISENFDLIITPVLIFPRDEKVITLDEEYHGVISVFGKYLYIEEQGFYQYERDISYYDTELFNFKQVIVSNERIPSVIKGYKTYIDNHQFHYVSPSLLSETYVNRLDSARVFISSAEDDWLHLDVKYKISDVTLTFYDIYKSIQDGKRFMITNDYWIDLDLPEFMWIHEINEDQLDIADPRHARVRMNNLNFFKMHSNLPEHNVINAEQTIKNRIDNFLSYKPESQKPIIHNQNIILRDYQHNGYAWLWFLYKYKLSGLLCDDMGLGKTYQSIALLEAITYIKDQAKFLIVCPTSVISHWRDKLSIFKKNVRLHVYHGSERELKYLEREKYSVILTSYGVMRNDLEVLDKLAFETIILDEIQIAKNKTSLTNAALSKLNGVIKIGLTGTPIENDLTELKALFDIVLPNYLGTDTSFKRKFIEPIEQDDNRLQLQQLHRLINPFILRRTKDQVLLELPPKTEEIRTCELSQDQIKLYRDVINTKALSLVTQLNNREEKIPYLHIFSILNFLKQICNHPSQLEKGNLDYRKYESGKWDLFIELLEESLNSGFKVVVFTQYLNMLSLINQYLTDIGIQYASIRGSTTKRGEMIERFNTDPDCMVFTGSLKAAGLGINLVGGSVVIHYDRWWNAAREDQATDRVHRIGQTRGVQVFKLLTEGTLEDKIDKIIRRKKKLMNDLVQVDDAQLVKTFDRDELIELLAFSS